MSVPAFGHLRINAYLQLPAAFRSLSRPSSAPDAKAFSICSSSLELPSVYYLHNIGCSLLAWIAVIILYSYLSFLNSSLQQNCFFYLLHSVSSFDEPLEKPDFFNLLFFPFTLSVMYENKFLCFVYSVFNEHWFFSTQFRKLPLPSLSFTVP